MTQPQPIRINPAQLDAQKRQALAEKALWQARYDALIERGTQEIMHLEAFCKSQGYVIANSYRQAIKADYEAQADLIFLSIARLQSQIEIMDAALAEAAKTVVVPGAFPK